MKQHRAGSLRQQNGGDMLTNTCCFIVKCSFCGKEKSREERPDLEADRVSHGMCEPICEEAKKIGWGKYVSKKNGGDL